MHVNDITKLQDVLGSLPGLRQSCDLGKAAAASADASRVTQPAERLGAWGLEAQRVVLAAVEAVQLLGEPTVAQGWQRWRGRGKVPSQLVRDVRNLDAAAALLRHPGAAAEVLRSLEAWLCAQPLGSAAAAAVQQEELACINELSGVFNDDDDSDSVVQQEELASVLSEASVEEFGVDEGGHYADVASGLAAENKVLPKVQPLDQQALTMVDEFSLSLEEDLLYVAAVLVNPSEQVKTLFFDLEGQELDDAEAVFCPEVSALHTCEENFGDVGLQFSEGAFGDGEGLSLPLPAAGRACPITRVHRQVFLRAILSETEFTEDSSEPEVTDKDVSVAYLGKGLCETEFTKDLPEVVFVLQTCEENIGDYGFQFSIGGLAFWLHLVHLLNRALLPVRCSCWGVFLSSGSLLAKCCGVTARRSAYGEVVVEEQADGALASVGLKATRARLGRQRHKRLALKEKGRLAAVKRDQVSVGGVGYGCAWFCFVVGFLLCSSLVYTFVDRTADRPIVCVGEQCNDVVHRMFEDVLKLVEVMPMDFQGLVDGEGWPVEHSVFDGYDFHVDDFMVIDFDGNGLLDAEEFTQFVTATWVVEPFLALSDVDYMIRAADVDGDGQLNFDEWDHEMQLLQL